MTRKEERKMDTSRNQYDPYTEGVEARFDKEAEAKKDQRGSIRSAKIGQSHADDGGEHRF